MTDTQFEFINPNVGCGDISVKEELIKYETEDFHYQNKCGEIFAVFSGNFILICGFCHDKFENMLEFGTHIEAKHQENIRSMNNLLRCKLEENQSESQTEAEAVGGFQIHSTHSVGNETVLYSDADSIKNDFKIEIYQETQKESEAYSCNICDQTFELKQQLDVHYSGGFCQESFLSTTKTEVTPIKKIKRSKKPRKRKEQCDYSNDDQDHLPLTEIRDSLKGAKAAADSTACIRSIPCDKCDRLFKSNRALSYHIARQHSKAEAPKPHNDDPEYLRCKYCNKEFPTRPECQEHEKTHNEEKPYLCWHCYLGFKTSSGRKRHIRIHTGERRFQCEECPKSFDNKDQLESHIDKHKNPRKFTCQTCGESFPWQFQLGLHEQRRHTGFRPLVCEDCGKRFVTLGELTQHRIRHSDVKDWKCEVCGKCFYSKCALEDHMAAHSDAKPFGCEVCGRRFSRPKALKKHKNLHSDVKAYVCNICGKAYAQDSGLYAHKKTHGIKTSQ